MFLLEIDLEVINNILVFAKHLTSLVGSLVILVGAMYAICQFVAVFFQSSRQHQVLNYDKLRVNLGRSILLGLEFFIAADVIETTTTPDYYSLGILGLLVVIRTFLNYFLNKDVVEITTREKYF